MKRIVNVLIAAVLFFTASAWQSQHFAGAGLTAKTGGIISKTVTQADVIAYLTSRGYEVYTCDPITGTCNWFCLTSLNEVLKQTTVFTNCNVIIGHEDVDI